MDKKGNSSLKEVIKMFTGLGTYLSSDYRYQRDYRRMNYKVNDKVVKYLFFAFGLLIFFVLLSLVIRTLQ